MDLHPAVTTYIDELEADKRAICQQLRTLLATRFPGLREDFKWKRPVYATEAGPICYMVALKAHVDFGLNDGAELTDERGVLQGTGKKMRHIKLRQPGDINQDAIAALLEQAIVLRSS
jgi:hypothetical protein